MKKPFMVICAGAMLALLAGCSSNYVMTTKSGQRSLPTASRSWIKKRG
jgi:type IV pilus biogenesis protein CpaD/CtpE